MTVILENKETLEDRFKIIKHLISIGYVPAVGGGYLATSSWMLSFDVMWELPCRWRVLFRVCSLVTCSKMLPCSHDPIHLEPSRKTRGWNQTHSLEPRTADKLPVTFSWAQRTSARHQLTHRSADTKNRSLWLWVVSKRLLIPWPYITGLYLFRKLNSNCWCLPWPPESLLPGCIWPLCPHTGWITSQLSLWRKTDQSIGGSYNHQIEWDHNGRQFF